MSEGAGSTLGRTDGGGDFGRGGIAEYEKLDEGCDEKYDGDLADDESLGERQTVWAFMLVNHSAAYRRYKVRKLAGFLTSVQVSSDTFPS